MRNCFKRYDKANGNIDFNSVSAATGAPNASSGNAPATGSAAAMSSQPTSNTQTQQAPSPMIKSGGTHHKSVKSTGLTQHQMQNVRTNLSKFSLFILKPIWPQKTA